MKTDEKTKYHYMKHGLQTAPLNQSIPFTIHPFCSHACTTGCIDLSNTHKFQGKKRERETREKKSVTMLNYNVSPQYWSIYLNNCKTLTLSNWRFNMTMSLIIKVQSALPLSTPVSN